VLRGAASAALPQVPAGDNMGRKSECSDANSSKDRWALQIADLWVSFEDKVPPTSPLHKETALAP
jgi:hypothetical protein